MPPSSKTFHQFLGLHSLLIGIFPFYLPVFLWRRGIDLPRISLLIAVTGCGFLLGLWLWDRLRQRVSLNVIFNGALLLLFALLLSVRQVDQHAAGLILVGLCYGLYNSFFWTTQRALFVELIKPDRAGQAYGNFQLFVFAAVQIGILIGGWLLEHGTLDQLLLVCACFSVLGSGLLSAGRPEYPQAQRNTASLPWREVIGFKDAHASRTMFLADGCYLFLESYFWLISLFLLARESFSTLGYIVIVLAVIFGGMFYVLKNTIDRLQRRTLFTLAVALYGLSWMLRAVTNSDMPLLSMFVTLVLITFSTSFFRLALNKRFYDLAGQTQAHRYLIIKSYYSQFAVVCGFLLIALAASRVEFPQQMLSGIYWLAALMTPIFLLYGARRYRHE